MALIRRVSFYCALTVFTALCSACSKTETPVGPSPVSPPVAVNNDTDGDGILNTVDRCPTQPETKNGVFDKDGCPDQIADLYTVVKNDVDFFWNTYFNTVLFRPYFAANMRLFRGTAFGNPCGAGPGSGPFYCNFDAGMYLDETFLESQLTRIGDFAVAVIIAHEIGHHTQNILGVPSQFSIQKELQADCLAGGWAASANIRGQLDNGDLQEGARSLFEVGDPAGTPWFAPSAHGSPAQRNQAFATGFARGAFFCSS